jgi:uncharacterized membrane protein
MAIVVVVVVAVVVVAVVVVLVRRREPNTVDSFQRQIDALSPEARRSVVDQVNQKAAEEAEEAEEASTGNDPAPGDPASDDDTGTGGRPDGT